MDVEQPAAGENLAELVFLQLIHAGAAGHDYRFDVEIVQRVCDAMEQHAVGGGDRLALGLFACRGLRITAAQITRRQHGLHAKVEQHRLRGEADLAEQPFGAAAREIKHRVRIFGDFGGIADHRHHARVFDVEQRARRLLRQSAGHRFVDEVDDLCAHCRLAGGGRRLPGLLSAQPQ